MGQSGISETNIKLCIKREYVHGRVITVTDLAQNTSELLTALLGQFACVRDNWMKQTPGAYSIERG